MGLGVSTEWNMCADIHELPSESGERHRGSWICKLLPCFVYLTVPRSEKKTCTFSAWLAMYLHDWNANLQICNDPSQTPHTITPPAPPHCQKQPEVWSLRLTNRTASTFQSKGIYFLIRNYTSSPSVFIDAKPGDLHSTETEGGDTHTHRGK